MTYTPFIWPLVLAIAVLSGLALYARRYRGEPTAGSFQALMWLSAASALIYLHEISVNSLAARLGLSQARFIPLALIAPTLLVMSFEYTRQRRWLAQRRWLFFYIIPGITILLSLTGDYHHLFRYNFQLNQQAAVSAFLFRRGAWWYVYYTYSLAAIFGAAAVLLGALRRPRLPKSATLAMTAGVLLAIGVDLLYVLNLTPIAGYYWTPSAFLFSGLLFGWALLRGRMFDLTPVHRNTVLQHIQDLALVLDDQDRLVDYNRSAAQAFGLTQASLGLPVYQVFSPATAGASLDHSNLQNGQTELRLPLNGELRVFDLTLSPIIDRRQRQMGKLLLLHDISQRKQIEERLQQRGEALQQRLENILLPESDLEQAELRSILDTEQFQALLDDLYDLTQVGVAILDLHGDILAHSGWQDVCKQFHRVHPDTLQNCIASNAELASQVNPGEYRCLRCKNNLNYVTTPIFIGGRRSGILHLGQFFYDDEPVDINRFVRQAKDYGFDQKAYLAALRRVPRWSHAKVDQAMQFYSRLAGLISQLSYSNLKLAQMLEREKQAQAALAAEQALLQNLMDSLPEAIYFKDRESRFIRVNQVQAANLGLETPAQAIGKSDADFFSAEHALKARQDEQCILLNGEPLVDVEESLSWPDGRQSWVATTKLPLYDVDGALNGSFGVSRDINTRKLAEQKLKEALAQKETLLREIHHRVKNNLAVVASLLELQAIASGDERLRAAFQDSQQRLQAMARIHEQLYRAQDLQHINMQQYLEAFTSDLHSYDVLSQTDLQVQPVLLNIDQAIPCGLIINELVTNALKYAFSDGWSEQANGGRPTVRVLFNHAPVAAKALQPGDGRVRLEVSDNGLGLPVGLDLQRNKRLGLRLVTRLTDQLRGELDLNSAPGQGARFVITFPISP